jgi:integrase
LGLLPNMQARPNKNGRFTYRYLTYEKKWINLGQNRIEAIRKVLELEERSPDFGTFAHLVRTYFDSPRYKNLAPRTRTDYTEYSKHVLAVFGNLGPSSITAPHISRYINVERKDAPVRANREKSFMSAAFRLGIELGWCKENPARMVKSHMEQPRNRRPEAWEIDAVFGIAENKGVSSKLIGLMARFAALTGARRSEFLKLRRDQITEAGVLMVASKRKRGQPVTQIRIEWSAALHDVIDQALALPRPIGSVTYVFCNRQGQPYTDSGFKAMWARIMNDWVASGCPPGSDESTHMPFTFHDLRSAYATTMMERKENPNLHSSLAVTERVYVRQMVKVRKPAQ